MTIKEEIIVPPIRDYISNWLEKKLVAIAETT